jgi:hypothetical protein
LFRQLLDLSGTKAPVTTEPELPMCQIGRFKQGNVELVGVLPGLPRISWAYTFNEAKIPDPMGAKVQFRQPGHVYDVRAGKYLGRSASCETRLQPGRAELFALLPYRVTSLELDGPDIVRHGEAAPLKIRVIADGGVGLHIFRLTFHDPDGSEARHYARNVKAAGGAFTGNWTPALNDAVGVWEVVATDVISGEVVRKKFSVIEN